MTSPSISKIHINNATRMSLNDRFTAFAERPTIQRTRSRSRSRSAPRPIPKVEPQVSSKNRRFLMELERKHKLRTALKLKRRSMRVAGNGGVGGGNALKRGSIKAMRLSPSGKPIKTNSMTKIATMKADLVASQSVGGNRSRRQPPMRRSLSSSRIAGRLGSQRPVVGGAAERVARRRMARMRGRTTGSETQRQSRPRSRSRSRVRNADAARQNNNGRQRSRSRSRARMQNAQRKAALPIKARLGMKPGASRGLPRNASDQQQRNRRDTSRRRAVRGIVRGRVEKPRRNNNQNNVMGNGGGSARNSGRARGRSRSRTRRGQVASAQHVRNVSTASMRRQGHVNQQRNTNRPGKNSAVANGNNFRRNNGMRNGRNQQRRGRSRTRGGRNEGINKPQVNKDELDKELDQYMATTKTENDMDYLLKN